MYIFLYLYYIIVQSHYILWYALVKHLGENCSCICESCLFASDWIDCNKRRDECWTM